MTTHYPIEDRPTRLHARVSQVTFVILAWLCVYGLLGFPGLLR